MTQPRLFIFIALTFSALYASWGADVEKVLILHTNDIHDHVRPGYDGVGGLAYVSGYIASQRKRFPELVTLDAGDVTEKGDLVAFRAGRTLTYEAMGRIGFDAVTLGNHDNDAGIESLRICEVALKDSIVCLNRIDPEGSPLFEPSRIIQAGRAKLGVIGMIKEQDEGVLSAYESGLALAREAERLRPQVDVVIALCHAHLETCAQWSEQAPQVDLFVCGHSHEPLFEPRQVPSTGAWLAQAGCYAKWVGRLELEVDLENHQLRDLSGELVSMQHDAIPVDSEMANWIREQEAIWAPEANNLLFDNQEDLDENDIAFLGAEALRRASGAQIGFCHGGQIIRGRLPKGPVDVNAVFLTGGYRAHENVRTTLSGSEVTAYLQALSDSSYEPGNWAGFASQTTQNSDGSLRIETSLSPEEDYTIIMPRLEWETRFLRIANQLKDTNTDNPLAKREFRCAVSSETFTEALSDYLAELSRNRISPASTAQAIPNGVTKL